MPEPNQMEKEMDHIFFSLFETDLEDEKDSNEEDLTLMSILSEIDSKHGTDTMSLLLYEDLRSTGLNLPVRLSVKVKSFQFYLKHLKEKGLFSIDGSFDY